ncbi:hypothetical protein ACFLYR_09335, partial [Chloroflexota bacterium]
MGMAGILDEKFTHWTHGKNPAQARLSIYQKVRDIPYAVIPELNDTEKYIEIFKYGKGSCMPKHFLLCNMFQRLGMMVLYAVFPFRWDDVRIDYPANLRNYHLACRVDINGKLALVDATLDLALEELGLPVNIAWDGV